MPRRRKAHSDPLLRALLVSIGADCTEGSLDSFIRERNVPKTLDWEPSFCIVHGKQRLLIHVLASPEFPIYIEKALGKLKRYPRTKVLLVARDLTTERHEGAAPVRIFASKVARSVAEKALALGCGLMVESEGAVHFVFNADYRPPKPCTHGNETGHIPKWLYTNLATSESFSPYLLRCFKAFAKQYARATRKKSILDKTESDLLLRFATKAASGDPRLFFPIGDLSTFKQYEASGANKRTRDHFFHTFNNLFLGFVILGSLANRKQAIADVDRFIKGKSKLVKLRYWEALWLLTCLFHDPAYMAEHFWAHLRFAFGVPQREGVDDEEVPREVLEMIRSLWYGEFAGPRKELHDLYNRTVRKWVPSSVAKKGPDVFDKAVQKAYFDGRGPTHSLVSGLRLISLCKTQNKAGLPSSYQPETAETACFIAALCMMFHDQGCRQALKSAGIPPIAFENLPYATVLMYVDSLQDDRRTIETSRFPDHGVLDSLEVSADGTTCDGNRLFA